MSRPPLNMPLIEAYVCSRHMGIASRDLGCRCADPNDIAERAVLRARESLCRTLTSEIEAAERIQTIRAGGLLVYSLQYYGAVREDLCHLADVTVAELVSSVTPDSRLLAPKRTMDQLSKLGQASADARVVALATIEIMGERLATMSRDDLEEHVIFWTNWIQTSFELLDCLEHHQTTWRNHLLLQRANLQRLQRMISPGRDGARLQEAN